MLKPAAAAVIVTLLACSHGVADEPQAPAAPRVVLVGDSTVATYAKPPADRPELTGWGQVFDEFFKDGVTVVNCAVSGRSSKSFIREGRWKKALEEKPDYVFIQFGHNDCPGKGDRTTDPNGDYRDYLRQYINDTRSLGAKPILVTPVSRRLFKGDQLSDHTLEPYAQAMHEVGQELHVPVLDLYKASCALYLSLGDEGSAYINVSPEDRTHFSRKGAIAIAGLVAKELAASDSDLASWLKTSALEKAD